MGSVCFLKMESLQEIPVNVAWIITFSSGILEKSTVPQLKEQDTPLQYLKYLFDDTFLQTIVASIDSFNRVADICLWTVKYTHIKFFKVNSHYSLPQKLRGIKLIHTFMKCINMFWGSDYNHHNKKGCVPSLRTIVYTEKKF